QNVIDNFPGALFAQFQFPRIVKEDWPSISKIKYAMADLLYFQKDWEKCGPAFDAVVEEDPNGPNAAEAAYAAVLCYNNIYVQKYAKTARQTGGHLDDEAAPGKPGKKKDPS